MTKGRWPLRWLDGGLGTYVWAARRRGPVASQAVARVGLLAFGAAAMMALNGCGDECNGSVCIDGALVQVVDEDGAPVVRFTGTASTPLSSAELGCAGVRTTQGDIQNFLCLGEGMVNVFTTAETLELSIEGEDGSSATETFDLQYEPVFPNGPECPAGCEQAMLTLTLR